MVGYQSTRLEIAFGFGFAVLVVIFALSKVFFGLDFTDELQHYWEIHGFVTTGTFFSNDLFIQQSGYIFLYPFVKLLGVDLVDLDYFVLSLRLIHLFFVFLVVWVSWLIIFRKGISVTAQILSTSLLIPCLIGFAVFSFNYNTMAMLILVPTIAIWLEWHLKDQLRALPLLTVAIGWIYPTVGLCVAAILFVSFFFCDRNHWNFLLRVLLTSAVFIAVVYALGIVDLDDALESISHSKGFGVANKTFPWKLLLVYLLSVLAGVSVVFMALWDTARVLLSSKLRIIGITLGVGFVGIGIAVVLSTSYWRHSVIFYFAASICFLFSAGLKDDRIERVVKIVIMSLLVSLTYAITSGNGFDAFYRGFLLGLPFIFYEFSRSALVTLSLPGERWFVYGSGSTLIILLIGTILFHPYRDDYLWNLMPIKADVPAFQGLYISADKEIILEEGQRLLQGIPEGKKILVVGPHPWIYPVTQGKAETAMIYMHLRQAPEVYAPLGRVLAGKDPEVIIIAWESIPQPVKVAIEGMLYRKQFRCEESIPSPKMLNAIERNDMKGFSVLIKCL